MASPAAHLVYDRYDLMSLLRNTDWPNILTPPTNIIYVNNNKCVCNFNLMLIHSNYIIVIINKIFLVLSYKYDYKLLFLIISVLTWNMNGHVISKNDVSRWVRRRIRTFVTESKLWAVRSPVSLLCAGGAGSEVAARPSAMRPKGTLSVCAFALI